MSNQVRICKGRRAGLVLAGVLGLGCAARPAPAEVIYQTDDPFGGVLGVTGSDVHRDQSVAVRFMAEDDFALEQVALWLWADSPAAAPEITVSLRSDFTRDDHSVPGLLEFERWTLRVPYSTRPQPRRLALTAQQRPQLRAGVSYWLVVESAAAPGQNATWALAQPSNGFMTTGAPRCAPWQPGYYGQVPATEIHGTPAETGAVPADAGAVAGEPLPAKPEAHLVTIVDSARRVHHVYDLHLDQHELPDWLEAAIERVESGDLAWLRGPLVVDERDGVQGEPLYVAILDQDWRVHEVLNLRTDPVDVPPWIVAVEQAIANGEETRVYGSVGGTTSPRDAQQPAPATPGHASGAR